MSNTYKDRNVALVTDDRWKFKGGPLPVKKDNPPRICYECEGTGYYEDLPCTRCDGEGVIYD